MDNIQNSVKILSQLYNNLNYWDEYGTSFIIFFVLMTMLFFLHSYFYVKTHIQPLKAEWIKNRCSLKVLPFAGLINKPSDKTIIGYTEENFTYCIQNILNDISGFALQPLSFVTHSLQGIFKGISGEVQNIRSMFNNVRTNIQAISEEIMGRLMNIMVPLQEVIIKMRDLFGKVQGVMTAGLYTLFGAYMTLQTLMGAIIQGLITVLVIIAATIAALIIIAAIPVIGEFVIPILVADIAIFISIAVPTLFIIIFASQFLQLQSQSLIPSFCFDKNTSFVLKDGTIKTIENLDVGNILENSDIITAKIKVDRKNNKMYRLNNTIVSENHSVLYNNKWIKLSHHPNSKEIINYNEPFIYCLNTSSKTITLNGNIYCDWDEIHEEKYKDLDVEKKQTHCKTDGGFFGETKILLENGTEKIISDIKIGDILKNGIVVNGIVEINGKDLEQFKFSMDNLLVKGGNNLYFLKEGDKISTLNFGLKERTIIENKEVKLYHLITNTKTFFIENIEFLDYDYCIDYLI